MLKICRLALLFCLLLLPVGGEAAPSRPFFLNGDENLVLVDTHQSTAWYLDRSSIYAELYQPPEYILQLYVVKAEELSPGLLQPNRMIYLRLRYNTLQRTMYYSLDDKNDWTALPPHGSWSRTGVFMPAGEAAFYLFFNEKFYGRWSFPLERDGKITGHASPFSQEFYRRLS